MTTQDLRDKLINPLTRALARGMEKAQELSRLEQASAVYVYRINPKTEPAVHPAPHDVFYSDDITPIHMGEILEDGDLYEYGGVNWRTTINAGRKLDEQFEGIAYRRAPETAYVVADHANPDRANALDWDCIAVCTATETLGCGRARYINNDGTINEEYFR